MGEGELRGRRLREHPLVFGRQAEFEEGGGGGGDGGGGGAGPRPGAVRGVDVGGDGPGDGGGLRELRDGGRREIIIV